MQTETKTTTGAGFTPGPWEVCSFVQNRGEYMIDAVDPSGRLAKQLVAKTFTPDLTGDGKANARLIAAAPDLYKALTKIERICGGASNGTIEAEVAVCARAALAKVAGL